MSNQEDIKNLMPTPVLRLFDNKDLSNINAVLYEMLAELDEMIEKDVFVAYKSEEKEWGA
jgi:hypothetical protein